MSNLPKIALGAWAWGNDPFFPGEYYPTFVNYVEGIYVGYRYYETAAEEGFIDYDKEVVFPFGHGLSYTTFTQEIQNTRTENGNISFDVVVTNTGDRAGKDVVELYYTPPYTNGGIEKASVNLLDFAKTGEIAPGASETVTIKDTQNKVITVHHRLYGDKEEKKALYSINWDLYLPYVAHHPNSFRNTELHDLLPGELSEFLDSLNNTGRGFVLQILADITEKASFDEAVSIVSHAIHCDGDRVEAISDAYLKLFPKEGLPSLPDTDGDPEAEATSSGFDAEVLAAGDSDNGAFKGEDLDTEVFSEEGLVAFDALLD